MYNSQHVNNDPEPYIGWSGKRYDEDGRTYASLEDGPVDTDPRPEYDNNPNPILIAYRESQKVQNGVNLVEEWVSAFCAYDAFGGFQYWSLPGHPFLSIIDARDDELEHARKVLTRLVTIYGEEK